MSTRADVSVILPWVGEPEIGAALESIEMPAGVTFEIAVVDDRGPRSAEQLPRAARQLATHLIRTSRPSGSPGLPRNDGLAATTGEYVMFVDADDVLTSNAIGHLLEATRADIDLVVGQVVRQDAQSLEFSPYMRPSLAVTQATTIPSGEPCPELVWHPVPVAKLYRREFLEGNRLRFPESCNLEDVIFNTAVLAAEPRLRLIPESCYLYRHYASTVRQTYTNSLRDADAYVATVCSAYKQQLQIAQDAGMPWLVDEISIKFLESDLPRVSAKFPQLPQTALAAARALVPGLVRERTHYRTAESGRTTAAKELEIAD